MRFLGVEILQSIVLFFQSIKDSISLEYLLYIFVGLEVLTIFIFIFIIHNVYEIKLIRAVDKLNEYLYNVQYIDESNLIEFNNRMKRVPKTLRYHWQQYMLYREKTPSYYMSVENCIDRPIKASAFSSNIKIVKSIGVIYAILSFIFSCGWAAGLATMTTEYFITVFTIPLVILFLNYIFLIGLNAKRASNTRDLYQTFHIFNRFIDKAVTTLPEYVDFEVLFTRKEIKRGIPVLNEYIEKRQIQEQEEMRKAKENAVQHELYNFEEAGERGELVLERAMKETEILVNLRNRLNAEIEQIEKEIDSYKRSYENTTKDYQKKLQASKENIERLREQQEATTNRIESNYIRKQQSDEIKKQQQIEKEQDDATLKFNQEINSLTAEIKKRKDELEIARLNVEKAMFAEYKTFSNKIFIEVRDNINQRVKAERDELINTRELIAKELEESLTKIEQLEKQNKVLVTKAGERESFIRAKIGKENEKLLDKIKELEQVVEEKNQHIALISENTKIKVKEKKPVVKEITNGKKGVVEGEFSFDDEKKEENKFISNFEGPKGEFDLEGNYRYSNGTYYDAQGYFHDENGNIFDLEGNIVNQKPITPEILKDLKPATKLKKEEIEINEDNKIEFFDDFNEFDIAPKTASEEMLAKEEKKLATEEVKVAEFQPKRTEGDQTKGKRGRPRKEKVEEVKPKGKRGRPRKEITEEPKKKGKRGRPRKEITEEPKTKGKRGRPKKIVEREQKPAGKRGRPKKINIDDLKEIEKKIKKQNDLLKEQHEDLKQTVKKVTKK